MGSQRKIQKGVYVDGDNLLIIFTYQNKQHKQYLGFKENAENIRRAVKLYNEITERINFDKKYGESTFNFASYFPDAKNMKNLSGSEFECGKITFGAYALDVWLPRMEKKIAAVTGSITPKTYKDYKSYLNVCKDIACFWDMPMDKIRSLHIVDYMDELALTRKAKTINNLMIPFRPIFERAFIDGIIKEDIMQKVKNPSTRGQQPEIYPFSYNESQKIISAAKEHFPEMALWFGVGFLMGMRITEMQAMKWKYFDFENWTYHVCERIYDGDESDETKTFSGSRNIIVPRALRSMVEKHKEYTTHSEYVFLNSFGNPYQQSKHIVSKYWIELLNICEIEFRKMRQMRHSFAIQALEAGFMISDISKYMGHKSVEVTIRRYVKFIKKNDIEINIVPPASFAKEEQI